MFTTPDDQVLSRPDLIEAARVEADGLEGSACPTRCTAAELTLHNDLVTRRTVDAAVVDTDVDTAALTAAADDPRAGAVVTFCGVVRNHDQGRAVTGIDYVGHPSAGSILDGLARDLVTAEGVHGIVVRHRIGSLGIGGVALFVAVAASHRRQGFDCAAALVERIKAELPIWKKQYFTDGTHEWSECP